MKRLFSLFSLLPMFAAAATLSPIQLLNPAGSTSGQAIVSTGSSSAPAWGSVTAGTLAPIAANTVLGNFTGSNAAPAAFAVTSCSTANSALKYTSGTGLSCGTTFALTSGNLSQFASTTSAQLLGVLSDETGTGVAVFSISPALTGTPTVPTAATNTNTTQAASTAFVEGEFASPPAAGFGSTVARPVAATTITASSTITPNQTAGIVGTTTNNSANVGSVGEFPVNSASGVSLTTGVSANITSVSLTAGDWDVSGVLQTVPAGTTTTSSVTVGISTTSATLGALGSLTQISSAIPAGSGSATPTPVFRVSLASTTTVFLVGNVGFAVSTMTANGLIRARRVR